MHPASASQREFRPYPTQVPGPRRAIRFHLRTVARARPGVTTKSTTRAPYSVAELNRLLSHPSRAALGRPSFFVNLVGRKSHLRRPGQRFRQNQRHPAGTGNRERSARSFLRCHQQVAAGPDRAGQLLAPSTFPSDASPKGRLGGTVRCRRGQHCRCAGHVGGLLEIQGDRNGLCTRPAEGFPCRISTHRLSAAFTSLVSPKSSAVLRC